MLDVKLGIVRNKRWLVLAVCYIMAALMYVIMIRKSVLYMNSNLTGSWTECMAYCFKGELPFSYIQQQGGQQRFELPVVWLTIMILNLTLPLFYPIKTIEIWGYQYILRSGRRTWWISKYLYVVLNCVLSGIMFLLITGIVCAFMGIPIAQDMSYEIYYQFFADAVLVSSEPVHGIDYIFLALICPFFVILTLCLVELLISIMTSPILALMLMISWLVLSVYDQQYYFLGNYAMMIRSDNINQTGLSFKMGFLGMLLLCIGVFFVGLQAVKRKDILCLEKTV
jgi:hypothetical protein